MIYSKEDVKRMLDHIRKVTLYDQGGKPLDEVDARRYPAVVLHGELEQRLKEVEDTL